MIYNIYCDESNHLEHDPVNIMALGSVWCAQEKVEKINRRIKEIKLKHNLEPNFEIKWTKISPAKLNFYQDIMDYFFDSDDLHFRVVVINKDVLDHKAFNQNHDEWYYKMYFELLSKILNPEDEYHIYLDIKDTRGQEKVNHLHDILCNSMYDFERKILKKMQQVRSHEVSILQLTDLLIGAVQFANRQDNLQSQAKLNLVERIKKLSGYSLMRSTLPNEQKFNIFHWEGDSL